MISVNTLQEIIYICHQHNIKITTPPRHYYWGTLELVIKDPDGVVLVFIAAYSEEESKAIQADPTFATRLKYTSSFLSASKTTS